MKLYTERMDAHCAAVEQALPTWLPAAGERWDTVTRAMHYACEGGGKRLRPVLLLESCRLCGGDVQAALPFACALEMIHSYSLVHDDLPCMDNSPMRRGKPSVHAAFGEDMALLAGDALLNRAFEVMLDPANPATAGAAAFAIARAAGIGGMVGGQVIDLESEGKSIDLATLEALQDGKTAALLQAACEAGALAANASPAQVDALKTYGRLIGQGFQIIDDILDVTADSAALGKPVGSDAENGKTTYVSLLGLEKARTLAAEKTAQAVDALAPFGADADDLRQLATALLNRQV